MAVQLPRNDVDERLRSLEDPVLLERLLQENPALFGDQPPQTQRGVLAWTTRRFGTIVLAVTGAVSIVAGYMLGPLAFHPNAPPQANVRPAVVRVAQHHSAATHPHHAARPPLHITRAAPAPVHHAAHVTATPHLRPQPLPPPVVHRRAVVHPASVVTVPAPSHQETALREQLREKNAELARLRAIAAEEQRQASAYAAAREAAANAAAREAAARADAQAAASAQSSTSSVSTTTTEPDSTTQMPDGTKHPAATGGIWTERPPVLTGPHGGAPYPGGIPVDPCTPRGGRVGMVLDALIHGNVPVTLRF